MLAHVEISWLGHIELTGSHMKTMKKPQSDTGRAYWTGKEFMSVGFYVSHMDMDFLHSQFASIRRWPRFAWILPEGIGITRVDFSIICPLFFLVSKWSWKSQRKLDERVMETSVEIEYNEMNFVLTSMSREIKNMIYMQQVFILLTFLKATICEVNAETINRTKPQRF